MTMRSRLLADITDGEGTSDRRDREAAMEAEKEKAKEEAVAKMMEALESVAMSLDAEDYWTATTKAQNALRAARAAGIKP